MCFANLRSTAWPLPLITSGGLTLIDGGRASRR